MDTEDVAAALAGFAIAVSVALDGKKRTPNQTLELIADELRGLVAGMRKRGDEGTPASEAMLITAAMLEASAPEVRDEP